MFGLSTLELFRLSFSRHMVLNEELDHFGSDLVEFLQSRDKICSWIHIARTQEVNFSLRVYFSNSQNSFYPFVFLISILPTSCTLAYSLLHWFDGNNFWNVCLCNFFKLLLYSCMGVIDRGHHPLKIVAAQYSNLRWKFVYFSFLTWLIPLAWMLCSCFCFVVCSFHTWVRDPILNIAFSRFIVLGLLGRVCAF